MSVEDFIDNKEGMQKEILLNLHTLILTFPGITSSIKYKIPFYSRKSWLCYLNPLKHGLVELAFTRANELSNKRGALNFKDRKQVAGIEFYHVREINHEVISEILLEALLLDDNIPYASKRAKKL